MSLKRAREAAGLPSHRVEFIGDMLSVGANGERLYGGVRIGTDNFHVGDTVYVKLDEFENGNRGIQRIDALWEDKQGAKRFEGRWYYWPEETTCDRLAGHDAREVFMTIHDDENPVECISAPCTVMEWDAYQRWLDHIPVGAEEDDDDGTYVCRAQYHPGTGEFVPLTGASTLTEAVRVGGRRLQLAKPVVKPRAPRGDTGSVAHDDALDAAAEEYYAYGAPPPLLAGGGRRKRQLGRFAEAAARLAPSATPERMPCREKERDEVIGALRAAVLEGTLGGSLYLSGTPGTGKTATVHQALRELVADRESLPPFRTIFVNGMKLNSPYEVYSILWQALVGQAVKPARAVELLEKRFSAPSASGKALFGKAKQQRRGANEKVILILDELDYLVTSRQSVIYNLFEWSTRGHSSLVVVGISNTMDLPERLLPKVQSRLNIRRVNFLPYSHKDIGKIIADRLGELDAFSVDDGGIELVARKVASVSGDVRRALELCRVAAQVAEREEAAAHAGGCGHQAPRYVTMKHVETANKQLRGSTVLLAVQGAPPQLKLMLASVVLVQQSTGRSEVDATLLRERHKRICTTLRSEEFPILPIPEQNEAIARLCASRLLDPSAGTLRLTAQPDDVKHVVRAMPMLAHLFPQTN